MKRLLTDEEVEFLAEAYLKLAADKEATKRFNSFAEYVEQYLAEEEELWKSRSIK